MSIALLFILVAPQQPAQPSAHPAPPTAPAAQAQVVARVDVQPPEFALRVGDTLRLRATAISPTGREASPRRPH